MKTEIKRLKEIIKKTDDESIKESIKKRLEILENRKTVCKNETYN